MTATNIDPAEEVKRKIHSYFAWTADIDANAVSIEVDDGGSVKLFGTVRTYAERDKAERAAWSVAGVTAVHNLLAVHP
jgi:osmotically-inducible protein OsmY